MNWKFLLIPLLEVTKVSVIAIITVVIIAGIQKDLKTAGLTDELTKELIENEEDMGYQNVFMNSVEDPVIFRKQFLVTLANLEKRVLAALLFLPLILALTNSASWNIVTKKRWSWKMVFRYAVVTAAWLVLWTFLFLGVALKFKPKHVSFAMPIWLFLFVFTSLLIFPLIAKEKDLKTVARKAKIITIKKPHHVVAEMALVYAIIQIFALIFFRVVPRVPGMILPLGIGIIFSVCWLKYYSYEVVVNAA